MKNYFYLAILTTAVAFLIVSSSSRAQVSSNLAVVGWGISVNSSGLTMNGIQFGVYMDKSTFNNNTVYIYKYGESPNNRLPATIETQYDYHVTIVPTSPLIPGQQYISVITTGVRSTTGLYLANDYACKFTAGETMQACPQLISEGTGSGTIVTDTQPPIAPTNLRASTITSSKIDLTWESATDNIGVHTYLIYKNDYKIAEISANYLQYSDTNDLIPGNTYKYYVKAKDLAGNISSAGNQQIVSIPTDSITNYPTLTPTPTPTPNGSTNCPSTSSPPTVSLTTSSIDIVAGVPFYLKTNGASCIGLAAVWWMGQGTGITDSTVISSFPNNPTSLVMFTTPVINPTSLDRAFGSPLFSSSQAVLNYSFISSVTIYKPGTYTFAANARDVLYPVSNQAHQASEGAGMAYLTINVRSQTNSIPTPTPNPSLNIPSVPSDFTVILSSAGTQAYLAWKDNSNNETGFEVFRKAVNGTWQKIGNTEVNVVNYTNNISGLMAGTYYYDVRACNSYGCSNYSNTSSIVINPTYYPTSTPIPTAEAVLKGLIKNNNGTGVANAWFHVFRDDYSFNRDGSTGADGSFQVSLPPGSYTIEIFPPDTMINIFRPEPQKITVSGGEIKSLTFTFLIGVKTITGTVLFSDGRTVTDAEVGAYSKDTGYWTSTPVDSNGRYNLTVSGGRYQIGLRPKFTETARWNYIENYREIEFAKDSISQIETVNITIPTPTSSITISAVDSSGVYLSNAGIVVDPNSAASTTLTQVVSDQPSLFAKTNSSGQISFNLKPGTYYIRGFLPYELGYNNPPEQIVNLSAGETKNIRIVFTKRTVEKVIIDGTTKVSDGSLTDAFVWAWSEKGRSAETRAGFDGKFNLEVSPDDIWHVGAGKSINQYPYKSSEIKILVGKANQSVELILFKFADSPIAQSIQTTQLSNEQIITQTKDGTKVIVQPNTITTSSSITVEVKPTVEVPSQPLAKVVGTAYDITIKNTYGQELRIFDKEIEISIPYNENDLKNQGLNEGSVSPAYFDETTGTWIKLTNFTIDRERNIAIARVQHLTRFALLAVVATIPTGTSNSYLSTYGLKEGDVISATGSSDPDIYIVNTHGYKRLFLNPVIFNFYGHLGGFSAVKNITSSTRDRFITSGLFQNCETGDPKVYGVDITGEDTGILHWINTSGEQAINDDPNFFKKVFCINNNEYNWYAKGANYTSINQVPLYTR